MSSEELNNKLNPVILGLLSDRGKSVFFSRDVQKEDAVGKSINATIGIALDDSGAPMHLSSISSKIELNPSDVFTYAPVAGKSALRSAWRESLYKKNPSLDVPVSNPVVVGAITHGLSLAGSLFVDDSDRIIVPDMSWDNYGVIFGNYGAELEKFPLFADSGFDVESFRSVLNKGWGKKIVLLPHNSLGYSPTEDEARQMAGAMREAAENGNKIVVILDDAYFGFFYGDCFRESLFALLAGIHENVLAIKIDGTSEEFYTPGLRVGFITYGFRGATDDDYAVLEAKTTGRISSTIASASHLSQSLLLSTVKRNDAENEDNFRILKRRYERTKQVLQDEKYAKYFQPLPFNSGYFMAVELGEKLNAEKVRQILLRKYDTGVVASGRLIRVAYCSVPEEKIEQLFENIYKACMDSMHPLMRYMEEESFAALEELNNPRVFELIEHYAKVCKPEKIRVLRTPEDEEYVRQKAIETGEEIQLETPGHTAHFDDYDDQSSGKIRTISDRNADLRELKSLFTGSMKGREMFVQFFSLGPPGQFSTPVMQITDSPYVAHSEQLFYRNGYNQFRHANRFFHFLHSSAELDKDKRRLCLDLEKDRVFAVNTQYVGNLRRLALRLAVNKANNEDWLAEHMSLMGVQNKNRKTYFCTAGRVGKTSTAMVSGNTVAGDDVVYLRKEDGELRAASAGRGVSGTLHNLNPRDDPVEHSALSTPKELIFSNVLVHNGRPYWLGMGKPLPREGINHSGHWTEGKTDDQGKEIPPAHKNARYTMKLEELENVDQNLNEPEGVPVRAIIYGGRDANTTPPVIQSFDWPHGVFLGASLETAVEKIDPMAMSDSLVVPLGKYLANHLRFASLERPPIIFETNYFLEEDGTLLTDKLDKRVWLLWMEGRVHREFDAIETPIGYIPKYEDLRDLFLQKLDKYYSVEDYEKQFAVRISRLLEKLERVDLFYIPQENVPEEIFLQIDAQRTRLINLRREFKKDVVPPLELNR